MTSIYVLHVGSWLGGRKIKKYDLVNVLIISHVPSASPPPARLLPFLLRLRHFEPEQFNSMFASGPYELQA